MSEGGATRAVERGERAERRREAGRAAGHAELGRAGVSARWAEVRAGVAQLRAGAGQIGPRTGLGRDGRAAARKTGPLERVLGRLGFLGWVGWFDGFGFSIFLLFSNSRS